MNNIKFSAMSNQELAHMLFTYPGMAEEIIAASDNVAELYALVEEELIPDGQINDDGDVDNNLQVRKILQKITGYMHNDPNHDIWENVWEKFSDDMHSLSRNKREASARFDIEADEELDDFYLKNPEMDDRPDSPIPAGMSEEEFAEIMGSYINECGEIVIPEGVRITPLQQREYELSGLEREGKVITEAEKLIAKQNQKTGEQK